MISLLFPLIFATTTTWLPPQRWEITNNDGAREYAQSLFEGTPLLAIAKCESGLNHWDDRGNILQGIVNHYDLGFFQISATYWLDTADRLGYNIFTPEGNIMMAKYIYESEGTKPWDSSKKCWGKKVSKMRQSTFALNNP